jgi:hypothetical protein
MPSNGEEDGSRLLTQFLTENDYKPVSLRTACKNEIRDPRQINVFVHTGKEWTALTPEDVSALHKKAVRTKRSFCTTLSGVKWNHKHVGMSSFKVFEVYKRADDRYAILAKVPRDYSTEIAAGLGGLGAVTAIGVTLARKGYFRRRPTGSQNIDASFTRADNYEDEKSQLLRTVSRTPLDGSNDRSDDEIVSQKLELLREVSEDSDENVRSLQDVVAKIPTPKQNLEDVHRTATVIQSVKSNVTPSPDGSSAVSKLEKDTLKRFLNVQGTAAELNAPVLPTPANRSMDRVSVPRTHEVGSSFFLDAHTQHLLGSPYYAYYRHVNQADANKLHFNLSSYLGSNSAPLTPELTENLRNFKQIILRGFGWEDAYYQKICEIFPQDCITKPK